MPPRQTYRFINHPVWSIDHLHKGWVIGKSHPRCSSSPHCKTVLMCRKRCTADSTIAFEEESLMLNVEVLQDCLHSQSAQRLLTKLLNLKCCGFLIKTKGQTWVSQPLDEPHYLLRHHLWVSFVQERCCTDCSCQRVNNCQKKLIYWSSPSHQLLPSAPSPSCWSRTNQTICVAMISWCASLHSLCGNSVAPFLWRNSGTSLRKANGSGCASDFFLDHRGACPPSAQLDLFRSLVKLSGSSCPHVR